MAAPATHAQPSRKGKKAWRKNVDITPVTSGLDDVREEYIRHGGVVAEKKGDELFASDFAGDEEGAKKHLQGKKLLKADEILAMRSPVPGLDGRKRKGAAQEVSGSGKRAKTANGKYVPHKEVQRLRAVADGQHPSNHEVEAARHDVWAEPQANEKTAKLDFLEEARPVVEPKTLKHPPTSLTTNGQHVPHVRKPHAGKSYNPLVDDWSALFEREGAAAVEAEKERLATEALEAEKRAKAEAEAAKVDAVEAAEEAGYATDNWDSAWESEWDGFGTENEDEVHTQKLKGRKTPVERNKTKARKERERKEIMEQKDKERKAQEKNIKAIAKAVSAKDKARQAQQLPASQSHSSDDDSDQAAPVRSRFGKHQIPAAPLELVLPDELEDSLRRLKPEGDLLGERYRNMLVNGKVEARRKTEKGMWKQRKVERTEKWGYKDWTLR